MVQNMRQETLAQIDGHSLLKSHSRVDYYHAI